MSGEHLVMSKVILLLETVLCLLVLLKEEFLRNIAANLEVLRGGYLVFPDPAFDLLVNLSLVVVMGHVILRHVEFLGDACRGLNEMLDKGRPDACPRSAFVLSICKPCFHNLNTLSID